MFTAGYTLAAFFLHGQILPRRTETSFHFRPTRYVPRYPPGLEEGRSRDEEFNAPKSAANKPRRFLSLIELVHAPCLSLHVPRTRFRSFLPGCLLSSLCLPRRLFSLFISFIYFTAATVHTRIVSGKRTDNKRRRTTISDDSEANVNPRELQRANRLRFYSFPDIGQKASSL